MKRNILKHRFTFGIEWVLIPLILGVIALPQARKNARTSSCVNNLKHLSIAALMYAPDNDDWCPEDKNLTDCLPMLATYIGDNEKVFICPMTKSQTPTYAFLLSNAGLKISQIQRPSSLPVFICDAHAKYQEVVVAFADGHVEVRKLPYPMTSYEEIVKHLLAGNTGEYNRVLDAVLENARRLDRRRQTGL